MPTEVKTYDPAAISINIGGHLVSGFEPGSFVTLTRSVNNYDFSVGPDGKEGIRSKRNDRSALLTLVLRQTAPSNLVLSNLANKDEAADSDGVVPVGITDILAPDVNFLSAKGWIEKPADATYAETAQGRSWQLRLAEVPMGHGGTPATAALASTIT